MSEARKPYRITVTIDPEKHTVLDKALQTVEGRKQNEKFRELATCGCVLLILEDGSDFESKIAASKNRAAAFAIDLEGALE